MTKTAERFKYEVERYISDKKRDCIEGNSCDYKGTSQYELDEIEKSIRRGFDRACALLDSMSAEEQAKLRKYAEYRLRTTYLDYKFSRFSLRNEDPKIKNGLGEVARQVEYCGPLWLSVYDDFVKARELTA